MKIKIFNSEEEWLAFKEGKLSGSESNRLIADAKRKMTETEISDAKKENSKSRATTCVDNTLLSEGSKTYILEKFSEKVAVDVKESFMNDDMQHGKDTEPEAFKEIETRYPLKELIHFGGTRFACTIYNDIFVCSPDLLCPKEFVGEIKCPTNKRIHVDRLLNVRDSASLKDHDADIWAQLQSNMLLAEVPLGLFISYYEGMRDPSKRLHIVEIVEDKRFQELLKIKIAAAEKEFERLNSQYQSLTV